MISGIEDGHLNITIRTWRKQAVEIGHRKFTTTDELTETQNIFRTSIENIEAHCQSKLAKTIYLKSNNVGSKLQKYRIKFRIR